MVNSLDIKCDRYWGVFLVWIGDLWVFGGGGY